MPTNIAPGGADMQAMAKEYDSGLREPTGATGRLLFWIALSWSIFQIYVASPIPFALGGDFVINSEQARLIHYSFAVFLAFLTYPALKGAATTRVPIPDWVLAVLGALSALYMVIFYTELSRRAAAPLPRDIAVAGIGVLILLEAVRRTVSLALVIVGLIFLGYVFAGPYMPEAIAHRGASMARAADHMWLSRQGIFGLTLDISSSVVFPFVVFGALLERAGAGAWFLKLAFALLGGRRGGPAKAAVVASAGMGVISGSALANVVTTGTFTIPLMKRVGFPPEKAAGIESTSSINGQLMPPVMGAAAFLMAEFVGISYRDVIMHAFLPAVISYIGLFYIVHIEAEKRQMPLLASARSAPWLHRLAGTILGFGGVVILSAVVYFGFSWVKTVFGPASFYIAIAALTLAYLALLRLAVTVPEGADGNLDDGQMPELRPTLLSGLHYLLPVVVLLWCLMVERFSSSYAIFWTLLSLLAIMLTQRPIAAVMRGEGRLGRAARQGGAEVIDGLVAGARNMVAIAMALAAAGIVVGTVSLTGVGLTMVNVIDTLSGGNLMLMLILTAVISIVLGMGLPTTANYVVVASIMAPVMVTLAAQSGVVIPLIAAHLFVFYCGLLSGNTPPVAVDAYAAAGLAKCSPMKTCIQAFYYSLRTLLLPFVFVFNTELLLIDVQSVWEFLLVASMSTLAMLLFVAALQNWFLVKSRILESALLLGLSFSLMLPGFWLNLVYPAYAQIEVSQIETRVADAPADSLLRLQVRGDDFSGREVTQMVALPLGPAQGDGAARLADEAGLELRTDADGTIVDNMAWDSPASQTGMDFGWQVIAAEIPQAQPSKYWVYPFVLVLFAGVVMLQLRRRPGWQMAQASA